MSVTDGRFSQGGRSCQIIQSQQTTDDYYYAMNSMVVNPPRLEPGDGFLDENETPPSTSDPDARLHRKEAKLCFMARALMENRGGLLVDARLTQPNGHGERVTALHLEPHADHPQASTPPASRISLRSMKAPPRVHRTQTTARRRSTDAPREPPDALGQRTPRTDRGAFGWMKTIGGQEKTKSLATSQPSCSRAASRSNSPITTATKVVLKAKRETPSTAY
jgi:hypothetical protein